MRISNKEWCELSGYCRIHYNIDDGRYSNHSDRKEIFRIKGNADEKHIKFYRGADSRIINRDFMVSVIMKFIKNNWFDLTVIGLFCISVLFSFVYGYEPVIEIAKNHFENFLIEMISFLPLLFILIGLFDVWVPIETITKHVGEHSGIKGIMIVILLATLQAGPLYGAFPVAQLLWKKGCSIRNIFIYLGAFSSLKLPMLTFEISFLGLKFSLLRTIITIPVFILIGIIMERYLKKRNFEVADAQ